MLLGELFGDICIRDGLIPEGYSAAAPTRFKVSNLEQARRWVTSIAKIDVIPVVLLLDI
jgi:hypothetical protein